MAFTPQVALAYLRGAQERRRLAHAYLITGAPGSGKRRLALDVAEFVNGAPADEIATGHASDVYFAEPESKSRRISIDQLRELERALQMQSRDGRRKVVIISDADRMGTGAANAFLKTLEEPPNNSLLLLLSAIPEVLPETILSRCLEISLASPNDTVLTAEQAALLELLNRPLPRSTRGVHEIYLLVQEFQRLLGQMRQTIQEENAAALKREQIRYKQTTEGNWLEKREEHYKALTESLYLQKRTELVEILFRWWGDVLRASSGVESRDLPEARGATAAAAARLTTPEILRRMGKLEDLRDHLDRNIQEALALEVAFLSVFRF